MRRSIVVAICCAVAAVVVFAVFSHNASVVAHKGMAYTATGATAPPTYGDWVTLIGTFLSGSGLSVASVVAAVIAFLKSRAQTALPNVPSTVIDEGVDITQILLIRTALVAVKEGPAADQLKLAGRSAFDAVRDKVFPTETK